MVLIEGHEEIAVEGLALLKKEDYKIVKVNKNEMNIEDKDLQEYDAILVRGAIVNKDIINNMPKLKIIARCGVGTDNIDIKTASKNDVIVTNVPDANFTSVAEHVVGLITALSHQIVKADKELRKGYFNARHKYMGAELKGKTIGIIGIGKIGQLVAEKCIYGLKMNVLTFDPYADKKKIDKRVKFVNSIDNIYSESDFISLHLPYTSDLHHFIDKESFQKMKNSVYLINCARGQLVDETALVDAIEQEKIAGAGIDVFEEEPIKKDNPILSLNNVIVTPHMGASTKESLTLMAVGAAKEIISVLNEKKPIHNIN